jgi:hypothetical protein
MMRNNHLIADFHCHPNLKSFGHSFRAANNGGYSSSHLWFYDPPTRLTKLINRITGLSKFRQADFTSLHKGNVRIAVVSFYPFEKGFFISGKWNGPVSARLANMVTGIGYDRVRYLQNHKDYFLDLKNEYEFFLKGCNNHQLAGGTFRWKPAKGWAEIQQIMSEPNTIAVVPSIEGAHVLNTGLGEYGRAVDEEEVMRNIMRLKQWDYPPFFITFAHNFNNNLCGHSRSLERLGKAVNQHENLYAGFTSLGIKALHCLLSSANGLPVYIDIKHMSVKSRIQYQQIVRHDYGGKIPIIVSHGALTGTSISGAEKFMYAKPVFSKSDINFYDEEMVNIARSGGVFALQLDGNRLAAPEFLRKSVSGIFSRRAIRDSAYIIWMQIQHTAQVLDANNFFSWGTMCIGSDFDGTINPLTGIWTAEDLPALAEELLVHANNYLKNGNKLALVENRNITPEEVVNRFMFDNAVSMLRRYYV